MKRAFWYPCLRPYVITELELRNRVGGSGEEGGGPGGRGKDSGIGGGFSA